MTAIGLPKGSPACAFLLVALASNSAATQSRPVDIMAHPTGADLWGQGVSWQGARLRVVTSARCDPNGDDPSDCISGVARLVGPDDRELAHWPDDSGDCQVRPTDSDRLVVTVMEMSFDRVYIFLVVRGEAGLELEHEWSGSTDEFDRVRRRWARFEPGVLRPEPPDWARHPGPAAAIRAARSAFQAALRGTDYEAARRARVRLGELYAPDLAVADSALEGMQQRLAGEAAERERAERERTAEREQAERDRLVAQERSRLLSVLGANGWTCDGRFAFSLRRNGRARVQRDTRVFDTAYTLERSRLWLRNARGARVRTPVWQLSFADPAGVPSRVLNITEFGSTGLRFVDLGSPFQFSCAAVR